MFVVPQMAASVTPKNYAVFGSTGECGKLFAQYALAAGAHLVLFVRDPSKVCLRSHLTFFSFALFDICDLLFSWMPNSWRQRTK
jgi:hypothetical protein